MRSRKKLEVFIEANLTSLYRFAYTYMRNKEDSEDVVSESIVKALKAFGSIKDESMIKCWLYKIVANTALTSLKKRNRCIAVDTDEVAKISEEDDYSQMNFESMINCLEEDKKAVLVLRFCDEMKFSEIAEVLEMNENTVKTKFYSALKKLGKEIEE